MNYVQEDFALIAPVIQKVMFTVFAHPDLYDKWFSEKNALDFDGMADRAGNHLFDDCCTDFKITKKQGHLIRTWFQSYSREEAEPVYTFWKNNELIPALGENIWPTRPLTPEQIMETALAIKKLCEKTDAKN